jgi:hypothetical protein
MKKTFSLFFSLALAFSTFAQVEFAPKNAVWRYTESYGAFSFYTQTTASIKYDGDTTLLGKKCKKFFKTFFSNNNGNITSKTDGIPILIYQEGEKVYRLVGTSFQLAYDFGAKSGDTITIKNGTTKGYKMLITNVLEEKIANEKLKKFEYKIFCINNTLANKTYFYQEKLGFLNEQMFPDNVLACISDGNPTGKIRCYSDNSIGEFLIDKTNPCNYVPILDISETSTQLPVIKVYFDKQGQGLNVEISEHQIEGKFRLFNQNSSLIIDRQLIRNEDNYVFDVSNVQNGFYFWQFTNGEKIIKTGKLIFTAQ